jgi:hypothetical protein
MPTSYIPIETILADQGYVPILDFGCDSGWIIVGIEDGDRAHSASSFEQSIPHRGNVMAKRVDDTHSGYDYTPTHRTIHS